MPRYSGQLKDSVDFSNPSRTCRNGTKGCLKLRFLNRHRRNPCPTKSKRRTPPHYPTVSRRLSPRRNRAAARNPARFEFDPARSTAARLSDVVRTLNAGGFGTQHPSHALPLQTAQRFCRVWPHGQGWLSLSKNSIEFGYLVFRQPLNTKEFKKP